MKKVARSIAGTARSVAVVIAPGSQLELDAATADQIAILRLRDGLSMAEYQKRAVEAYALMMPGPDYLAPKA